MLKRVWSLILALVLMGNLVPGTVFAQNANNPAVTVWETEKREESPGDAQKNVIPASDVPTSGSCGENVSWVLDDAGTLTISGTGPMADGSPWSSSRALIQTVVVEYGVTSIGQTAFVYCDNLTGVEIADSVTDIGVRAFYDCDGLTSIRIPGSVAEIGDFAFCDCDNLTGVELGLGVKTLGEGVFLQCGSLTDIELPEGLTTIGAAAFQKCTSLPNLQIPSSVTTIETGAFSYCNAMTKMVIPDTVTTLGGDMFWHSENIREVVLPRGLQKIENYFFANCSSLEKVVFPENPITLGENVFVCCYALRELDLPDSITSIGLGAFWYCDNLDKIDLPERLESIGTGAFTHCISLDTVHFPASVSSIATGLFSMCENLKTITVDPANAYYCNDDQGALYNKSKTALISYPCGREGACSIPDGVAAISDNAFYTSAVTRVDIPDSVTSIGEYAFYGCRKLTELKLPKNLAALGSYAFSAIGQVGTVEIPGTLSEIPNGLFESSDVGKIVISEGTTVLGSNAFQGCESLTEVVLPDTLTRIDHFAFRDCYRLPELVIPKNVEYIGYGAFLECRRLDSLFFRGGVPELDERVFACQYPVDPGCSVYYRADHHAWTKSVIDVLKEEHPEIEQFRGYLEYDENDLAYGDCGNAAKWVLRKDGTMTIFSYDEDADGRYVHGIMGEFTPGNAPWNAYLEEIRSVYIKEGIQNISAHAFAGCTNVTGVAIPDGVEWIGECAFQNCEGLAELTIPASVKQIGAGFLAGCRSLETLTVAEENTCFYTDAEGVLYDKAVARVMLVPAKTTGTCYLPASVSRIDDYAFTLCSGLSEVVFEGDPPAFGENAFHGAKLKAYYPADNTKWNDSLLRAYGGDITWIAYDNSLYFGADVQLHSKTADLELFIRPKECRLAINDSPIRRDLKEVTMYSILGETDQKEDQTEFIISQEQASRQDIVLKRSGYQDYVIPRAVCASVAALALDSDDSDSTHYRLDAYMTKLKSGKPYVSTVFGRESGSGDIYLELTSSEMNLEEGSYHDIIITVVGAEGKETEYIISQDQDHKVSNHSGVFSSADLYRTLDYGKKVYAYAMIEQKIVTEPVELRITKMQPPNQATKDFLKSTSLSLLGKDGKIVDIPENYPLVGGGKICMEAFEFPIGLDVNGSSVRISLGVDLFEGDDEFNYVQRNGGWILFKKELSALVDRTYITDGPDGMPDLDKALDKWDTFQTFRERYSNENSAYNNQKKNFDISVLGYAEGELVNGQLVFKEFLFSFNGEFSFRYTQQGAIWAVPAYFYVEAGAELDGKTNAARFLADRTIPMELGMKLDITPQLKLGGGAGIKDCVSAGIWGEGSIPILIDFTDQYVLLKLKGEFGAEAEFFIVKGDITLLSGEYRLVEWYYGSSETVNSVRLSCAAPLHIMPDDEIASVEVVSRAYAEETSEWMGTEMTANASDTGTAWHTLQSDVFRRSQPQIAALGDSLVMVWVEDDIARDEYNRMRLVYSIYDRTTGLWSEPQAVSDDGHNDAYPSVVSDGTSLYVSWQKIHKTLTAEDCTGIDALLSSSEIFLAQFDAESGSFLEAKQLTDNELYDYSPAVALESGSPVVYYASAAPDQINQAKSHTIYRYTTKAAAQKRRLNYILSITAENGSLAYVMDADGDLATTNDINVYKASAYTTSAFNKGENDAAYTYAAFAQHNGTDVLFVSDMSNIYYREDYTTKSVFDSERSITGDINILPGGSGPIILWTETVGDAEELYMVFYDGAAWTKPVMVSEQNRSLRDVHAAMLDGRVVGVCNCDTAQGSTNLEFFELHDTTDLALNDYIYFRESAAVPGEDCFFDVMLRNQGTTRIGEVSFTVTDGLGTAHTVTERLELNPGDFTCVTLSYPVPQNYAATTLNVEASVSGKQETDLSNNSAEAEIGKTDLRIREESIHAVAGGYVLNVSIENLGITEARDVVLDVSLEEDAAEPVFTQSVGSLDRKTYASVDVGIPSDRLVFDEDGIARVYLYAESSSGDASDTDNRLCILIADHPQEQCTHSIVEAVAGREADCYHPGFTAYERCAACGEKLTESELLPKLEHDMGDWTVTKAASCTEGGSRVRQCQRSGCAYAEAEIIVQTGHAFEGIECTRCGELIENPFTDVPEDQFYHKPVLWAVANGITTGATATTFNPAGECMRAHVVTFLWRSAGQPEPVSEENPFVDVKKSDFFYKAVLWAVEKGITNGVDATHFGPFAYCNRAQVVTFLYRNAGTPEITTLECPFTDVASGAWYEAPILWAVENGITNGMGGGLFGVNAICNRAQVVTFLYRSFSEN